MYVVLGGRGAVGSQVCKALEAEGHSYAAPSSREADARDAEALTRACQGVEVILCCVGLPYRAKLWRRDWPRIADALVKTAGRTGARLVFLDNVYMYGPSPLDVPMTEHHPQKPPSRKGQARKEAAEILLRADHAGRASVTIARAADFYGPGAVDSVLWASFLERMIENKRPQLLMTASARHTYAYTGDVAHALLQLAGDADAAGRVWHLPVGPAFRPGEWAGLFNERLGTDLRPGYLPSALSGLLGAFVPMVREAHEMRYQFDSDYVLNDEDFRARYPDFQITSYADGATALVDWAKARAG